MDTMFPTNGASHPVSAVAPSAKDLLRSAAQEILVDDPLTERQKLALVPMLRFPLETLRLVADAYDEHGAVIGAEFDTAKVREAIAFDETHRPIVAQARALAQRVEEQILVRRAAAAEACMGLYQAMKGLSRLHRGAVLRPIVKQIAATLKQARRRSEPEEVVTADDATAAPASGPVT